MLIRKLEAWYYTRKSSYWHE